ncbi:MAG TPA: hypothetical protein VIN59_05055, partial [Alphaproteobacteria bacterium]
AQKLFKTSVHLAVIAAHAFFGIGRTFAFCFRFVAIIVEIAIHLLVRSSTKTAFVLVHHSFSYKKQPPFMTDGCASSLICLVAQTIDRPHYRRYRCFDVTKTSLQNYPFSFSFLKFENKKPDGELSATKTPHLTFCIGS